MRFTVYYTSINKIILPSFFNYFIINNVLQIGLNLDHKPHCALIVKHHMQQPSSGFHLTTAYFIKNAKPTCRMMTVYILTVYILMTTCLYLPISLLTNCNLVFPIIV